MSIRMRHTRAHTRNRRAHHGIDKPAMASDKKDGKHLSHRVSPITGTYKGQKVLDVEKKALKQAQKNQQKESEKAE